MTTNSTPGQKKTGSTPPLINEAADRRIGRLMMTYGIIIILTMLAMQALGTVASIPHTRLFAWHRLIDIATILIVLLPFFIGISHIFKVRLEIGRDLVDQKRWTEAIAALDPFAGKTQRFLDTSGEAHYLLYVAYRGAGKRDKSAACQTFLIQHRPGPWADKVKPSERQPRVQAARADTQDSGPRPAKNKRRRRF